MEFIQVTDALSHASMSSSLRICEKVESVTLIEPVTSIGLVLIICAPFNVQVPEHEISAPNTEPVTINVPCISILQAFVLSGIEIEIPSPDNSSGVLVSGVEPSGDNRISLMATTWKVECDTLRVILSTSMLPVQSNSVPVQFSVEIPSTSIVILNIISSAKIIRIIPFSPKLPIGTITVEGESRFNCGGELAFMDPLITIVEPSSTTIDVSSATS